MRVGCASALMSSARQRGRRTMCIAPLSDVGRRLHTRQEMCVDTAHGKRLGERFSAAIDPRVAAASAAHRGLRYMRRTPVEECKWSVHTSRTLSLAWSDTMAYIVGLTATDGCLILGRRQVNFKSADRELVALYLQLLGRTNSLLSSRTRTGGVVYYTQFGDASWYHWLISIGLSSRKSLTLGPIAVPEQHLFPSSAVYSTGMVRSTTGSCAPTRADVTTTTGSISSHASCPRVGVICSGSQIVLRLRPR